MKKFILFSIFSGTLLLAAGGDFSVKNSGDDFQIFYRNKVLVDSVIHKFSGLDKPYELKRSYTELPHGRKVWNIWSEHKESRFRQEIVLPATGDEVEITMLTEATADPKHPVRRGNITVPWQLVENMSYDGKTGRTVSVKDVTGVLSDNIKNNSSVRSGTSFRQFAVSDGKDFNIVFDMNPLGVGDFVSDYVWNSIRGLWGVYRRDGKLVFESFADIKSLILGNAFDFRKAQGLVLHNIKGILTEAFNNFCRRCRTDALYIAAGKITEHIPCRFWH